MFISRRKYAARIQQAINETVEVMREQSADHIADIRKIANEEVAQANRRAEDAMRLLSEERQQHSRDLRHFASMWLRHNKSLPLPPTPSEKAEAKAEAEAAKNEPPPLTPVEVAMREANRRDAAAHGKTQEEADRDFYQKVLGRMMEPE